MDHTRTARLADRSIEIILAGQAPGGAFVASPTFSQYGYAWFRDGAFIAEGLDLAGRLDAAGRFHGWVAEVVLAAAAGIERSIAAADAGGELDEADYLHSRYRVDGSHGTDDWPTFQLDGPGIWLWSLDHHRRLGGLVDAARRDAARLCGRYLAALWDHPSFDAWEEWPDQVHTSTLAAIVAGLRALPALLGEAPEPVVVAATERVERALLDGSGPFTKWAGSDAVDGSLLWIAAPYGIVTPTHPRFAATLERIERELVSPDGGVHRYAADTFYGGGEWVLLTAALGRVYLRRDGPGDRARAERCLAWIEARAGADGSLPEQVATRALHPERIDEWREMWGESARPLLWSHATYLALLAEARKSAAR